MKGYKGTDKNMKCRGMQFEIGETFEIEGKPILCKNGFHFCLDLPDVFMYYTFGKDNRYFEVEADDNVTVIGEDKCVTSRIRIVRELSNKEVNRARYGNGYGYGYGNRYGNRHGDGNGYGCGDGTGCGIGYEHGYGNRHIDSILIWR